MNQEQLARKVELESLPTLHWSQKKELAKLNELLSEEQTAKQETNNKEEIKNEKVTIMTKKVQVQYLMKTNIIHNGVFFAEKQAYDTVPELFIQKGFAEPIETIL